MAGQKTAAETEQEEGKSKLVTFSDGGAPGSAEADEASIHLRQLTEDEARERDEWPLQDRASPWLFSGKHPAA